ncbi:MAG TPA: GNAT family protein [Phycisphaerales bacterium]|nr:GNAT family protein [Phycisphaerales bacterium]
MVSHSETGSPPHAVEIGSTVYLRYPTARDREQYVALRQRSREHLERWEPRPPDGSDAFGEAQFERLLRSRRSADQERFLILELGSRRIVGQVSLGGIIRGPLQSAFMGYWIGAGFTGRGYMTEAAGLCLRHAFRTLGLHRVEANIQPHNEPSRAVARKNRLRLEGFSPRYLKIDGRWADHERWAITVEEWRDPPDAPAYSLPK